MSGHLKWDSRQRAGTVSYDETTNNTLESKMEAKAIDLSRKRRNDVMPTWISL